MRGNKLKIVTLSTLLLAGSSAFAGQSGFTDPDPKEALSSIYHLEVIADRGGESIEKYIPKSQSKKRQSENFQKKHRIQMSQAHYPVVTNELSVGRLTAKEAKGIRYESITRPVFVVGYDSVSMDWMSANKELLSEKSAIGLVVNVANDSELKQMQDLVGEKVILQPTPGKTLAEHVKVRHYPFYVDNKGVIY